MYQRKIIPSVFHHGRKNYETWLQDIPPDIYMTLGTWLPCVPFSLSLKGRNELTSGYSFVSII